MDFDLFNTETESCIFEYKFCVLLETFRIIANKFEPMFRRVYFAAGCFCLF
jgi:hypothetical protein